MGQVALSKLVDIGIFRAGGERAGSIEEFIVDPNAGIVRFAQVRVESDQLVLLPWAAMTYAKSGAGFTLTHLGEDLLDRRLAGAAPS